MKERQAQLLKLIVEQYAATGVPIGSKSLVESKQLDVSGATVRNEMRDLELAGYLTHPHTSAGRIPTEAGYRYYVDNMLLPSKPKKKTLTAFEATLGSIDDYNTKVKTAAKQMSELVGNAVIVSFGTDSLYYTGISNLFAQPEFRDYAHTVEVSTIFDQCEERIGDLRAAVEKETKILIGTANPLGKACSVVARRISQNDIVAVLGPMRMNYAGTVGLVNHIDSLF